MKDVEEQLAGLAAGLSDALGDNLVGVYLHGSLVLGCFNPQRSDVDVLAVTRRPITAEEQGRVVPVLRAHSGPKAWPRTPPYPLEISFLTEAQAKAWRYPTPFDLHFSESRRDAPVRGGDDHDLATHVTILRAAGRVLAGPPVAAVFAPVPQRDFHDALRRELRWCRQELRAFYSVLTTSRIWATFVAGGVQSKETGAVWALQHAPDDFRPLIAEALALYRGEVDDADLDLEAANRYVDFVTAELG